MDALSRLTRRQFVSATATAAIGAAWPDSMFGGLAPASAAVVFEETRAESREKVKARIHPFPLTQVRLADGPCKDAMELDRRYLHLLSSGRLLHTFRVNAGLPSSAQPFGGWEKPDCELRGHFTGGHFLTACALMYASTGDTELKAKADALVAELAKCQKAIGNGYLSAFPEEFFDRLRNGVAVWAPFYTLHKIMAGHLDMYVHCGNEQALEVVEGMARWVRHWSQSLSDEHMARVKLTEFGGMNEVLYNLSAVSGKDEYLELGQRFDDGRIFAPLAGRRDELKGLHANTTIPKIIGAARGYELTGRERYRDIAEFFWQAVTSARAYCTGGTSSGEHWTTDPGKLAAEMNNETEECCCAYNMLRLTRHLIGWTADPRLADYYERVLFNHRLGTQNPEDGMMMYFLPLVSGLWKFFNSPANSFWCCTGTGVEEFAKLGDSIYFHDAQGLFINLFIASQVNWPEKGLRLRQETNFPEQEGTTLIVEADKPVEMDLHIRIPYWATRAGTVKLNGAGLPAFSSPSSYLTLSRVWKRGDKVEVSLPMSLHVSSLPGDETQQAMMYGPLVLAGRLGAEGLTRDLFYGEYHPAPKGEPSGAPTMTSDSKDPLGWIEPAPGQALTFHTVGQPRNLTLIPLYKLFGERYAVYWKVIQKSA